MPETGLDAGFLLFFATDDQSFIYKSRYNHAMLAGTGAPSDSSLWRNGAKHVHFGVRQKISYAAILSSARDPSVVLLQVLRDRLPRTPPRKVRAAHLTTFRGGVRFGSCIARGLIYFTFQPEVEEPQHNLLESQGGATNQSCLNVARPRS